MAKFLFAFALALAALAVIGVDAHGRLMWPASRSSLWRWGDQFPGAVANYNDNELFCGGLHQAQDPGTNCGVCGDPANNSPPRFNEFGGMYDKGIIAATYNSGQAMDVLVDLTTGHLGAMEFRLCTDPKAETQDCFNRNVLQLVNGGSKLPVVNTGNYTASLKLPEGVKCERCVLQWNYRAGNNYGDCGDGSSATGCGPQETFRGCADIRIL